MFVGHYGPALALKKWEPHAPLAALFVGVQLVDVAWSLCVFTGLEEVRIVPGITESNALDLVFMPYTHSLVAAILWSVGAGFALALAARRSARVGIAMALAVFSHWLLDLLVHRPDLPLYDDAMKLGLGLWNYRWPAFAVELATLFVGFALYLSATKPRDGIGRIGPWAFVVALVGAQLYQILGPPPPTPNAMAGAALGSYIGIAAAAWWIDRHRTPVQT